MSATEARAFVKALLSSPVLGPDDDVPVPRKYLVALTALPDDGREGLTRYTMELDGYGYVDTPDPDGEWVRYEDVAALAALPDGREEEAECEWCLTRHAPAPFGSCPDEKETR